MRKFEQRQGRRARPARKLRRSTPQGHHVSQASQILSTRYRLAIGDGCVDAWPRKRSPSQEFPYKESRNPPELFLAFGRLPNLSFRPTQRDTTWQDGSF